MRGGEAPGGHTGRPMDHILVRPGPPLSGRVQIGGAKNSALKLMAATLLAEGEYRLCNVPSITDVETMAELLVHHGGRARRSGATSCVIRPGPELRHRGALRAGRAHAGVDRRARPAARPVRRGQGGHARRRRLRVAAHRHAPGRPRADRRHVRASPRLHRGPGRPAARGPDPARVSERRRHREPAAGRGAGQGDHRDRQRRPGAGDRRPGRLLEPDGRHHPRRRDLDHRDRGRRGA